MYFDIYIIICCRFICLRNFEIIKRIMKGVRDVYGGWEKCLFFNVEIEGKCFLLDCVY